MKRISIKMILTVLLLSCLSVTVKFGVATILRQTMESPEEVMTRVEEIWELQENWDKK